MDINVTYGKSRKGRRIKSDGWVAGGEEGRGGGMREGGKEGHRGRLVCESVHLIYVGAQGMSA